MHLIAPFRINLVAALLLAASALVAAPAARAETIETSAKYAILLDYTTGTVLLEKNADELMHPSSMSKLMTVYMVFERLKNGSLSVDDQMPVSEKAWRKQGSKMFVTLGSKVKVGDLLRGVVVQSGNDACIVLAEGLANSEDAFAAEMTKRAREIGLTKSVFKNATGWPDPEHLMTARDLSTLARRLITDYPEYYKIFSEMNFTYNGITQGNRNPMLYKGAGADGLKTGHTEDGGFGLTASVVRDGRRLILVVNGLMSMKERAEEPQRLIEWGFREFDNYTLFEAGDAITDAEVWLGKDERVPLVAGRKMLVTLPRKARKDAKVTAVFDGPIPAPIKKGQQVGKLVIEVPGIAPAELPLVAGADVDKLGFVGRIGAAVKRILFGGRA